MTRPNNPRRGMDSVLRGKFLITLALLTATALFVAGCKKNGNAGNTSGNGNDTSQSSSADNTGDMKDMADKQGKATKPDKGNFTVQYSTVQDPRYAKVNDDFRQQRYLERVADELNASVAIPENVLITFKQCGQPNAFWDSKNREIVMCYELMDQMADEFRGVAKSDQELSQMVNGAMTFAFIHELGHCLIEILQLPSTGKEEDAVDGLATFVLVALNGDEGEQMAISGALYWGILYDQIAKSGKTAKELDMVWADEHSMEAQRFYNILCWVFGHNPDKWQKLVDNPLPQQRAVRCPQEYTKLATAWLTLLKPYLKDGGAKASAHTHPMTGNSNTAPSEPTH